ncbi:MAG: anthranilate synthase component I [Methanosarcina sp.]|nr:anthranilate synthase component I [Methanosarcina sp.]
MLSFDLGKEEFKELASGICQPGFIQLLARIDTITCSPLELYRTLRASGTSGYSYLLESVEKQASRARYSFVGSDPDAVIEIRDRKISLELLNPNASPFFEEVRSKIEEACGPETVVQENPEKENLKKENLEKENLEKENPEREDLKREDLKREDLKREDLKREDLKREELKREDLKKEGLKREELKREGLKREELKREELKKEGLKREELKREELKREELKREDKKLKNIKFTAPIPRGKDAFDALRLAFPPANGAEILNTQRFDRQTFLGGAIGYTAYDAIYDSWLGVEKGFKSEIPELQYLLVSKTFVFDHLTEEIYIVFTPFLNPGLDAGEIYEKALLEAEKLCSILKEVALSGGPIETTLSGVSVFSGSSGSNCSTEKQKFEESVIHAKEHIFAGDIFQAVLSRKCEFRLEQSPFELYMQLRAINPSPYMYIFEFGDLAIVGASPETLLTVHKRTVIINPIAGTCPRGKSEAEDEAFALNMLHDEKERAEHVMLVDLGRNDVRMVTESGSVKVSEFMKVLKYSHVQHIESTVLGTLRPECDQFDAFRAIFPAGTLSGAPKIRAMEIISELEASPRGIYGGGVGYYSWNGDADFAIVIRTVLLQGKKASVQAGAGIVADSDPGYEFQETERKMAAMLAAIGGGC